MISGTKVKRRLTRTSSPTAGAAKGVVAVAVTDRIAAAVTDRVEAAAESGAVEAPLAAVGSSTRRKAGR